MDKKTITHFGQVKNLSSLVGSLEKRVNGWNVERDEWASCYVDIVSFIASEEKKWVPLFLETNGRYYPCVAGLHLPLDEDCFYVVYPIASENSAERS